jgi:hypothetical protein
LLLVLCTTTIIGEISAFCPHYAHYVFIHGIGQ